MKINNNFEIHKHGISLTFRSRCSQLWLSCYWSVYQYHCLRRRPPSARRNVQWSVNVPKASSSTATSWTGPTKRLSSPAKAADGIKLFTDMHLVHGEATGQIGTFNGCKHSVIAFIVFNKWLSACTSCDSDNSLKQSNCVSQHGDSSFCSVSSPTLVNCWNVDSTSGSSKHLLTVVSITEEKLWMIGISARFTSNFIIPFSHSTSWKLTPFLKKSPQRVLLFQFPIDNCSAALGKVFKLFVQILRTIFAENANYLPLQRIDLVVLLRGQMSARNNYIFSAVFCSPFVEGQWIPNIFA